MSDFVFAAFLLLPFFCFCFLLSFRGFLPLLLFCFCCFLLVQFCVLYPFLLLFFAFSAFLLLLLRFFTSAACFLLLFFLFFCVCLGFCCFVFFDSARLAFVAFVALLLFCDSALVASVDVGFCLAIYCSALVAVRSTVWCTTAQLAHTRVLLHLHKHILDREASIHFAHTSVMVVLRCWWEQTLKYSTA